MATKNKFNAAHAESPASGLLALLVSPTLAAVAVLGVSTAHASASLEVYGQLPSIEDVALSPDGSRLALVRTDGDSRLIVVVSLADRKTIAGLRGRMAVQRSGTLRSSTGGPRLSPIKGTRCCGRTIEARP